MALRADTTGATQVVAFMVAAAFFMGAIGTVLVVTHGAGSDPARADAAAQDLEAGGLADVLLDSPGIGWAAGPDAIGRLGLGATNGSGLQQSSLDALRGASFGPTANGKVDYEDAQRSLGMHPAGTQDFHIRIYPVGLADLGALDGSDLRVAYVADWGELDSVTLPLGTPSPQMAQQGDLLLNLSMAADTWRERDALDASGLAFANRAYVAPAGPTVWVDQPSPDPDISVLAALGVPALEGDVYPDDNQYLAATLPGRLAQYDILVIGSGVDHSSLTADAVKSAVEQWVLAGGNLVVLGSASQSYQWLQPIFQAGTATVNGAPMAPDTSHPVLREPHDLDWIGYDHFGRGWDIKSQGSGAHYDDFSHVVVAGGEDVLAVSNEGAFGEGRIVLTTYMPRHIAATLGPGEAEHFFENVIALEDFSHLYLEYGPSMPTGTPVSVAVRQSWLWDDDLGQVPVRIEVHAWG